MSLRKVYGGTPADGESRCDTCAHGQTIQGYAESERIVFCTKLWDAIRIPFKVRECTGYEDRRLPNFEEMKEIAWQLSSKSAGHEAGFVTVEAVKNPEEEK
ncbi:MAG TPA: hypothetical protein VKD65_00905 [Candidatus Angelobacter sp.]|nr:hypothetical protein [Candidatus Angelobacter sp.]